MVASIYSLYTSTVDIGRVAMLQFDRVVWFFWQNVDECGLICLSEWVKFISLHISLGQVV